MIKYKSDYFYPSIDELINNGIPHRIHDKDDTVYDFSSEAQDFAKNFLGWTDLASNPPCSPSEIQKFAEKMRNKGIKHILLIGQGGSTQAPMTLTKYNKPDSDGPSFRTLDSVSPVRVRSAWNGCDPEHTLIVVSSKSGGTIEPMLILNAIEGLWKKAKLNTPITERLVAITDPGSGLAIRAKKEKWLKVFIGEPSVGGRYSALSVFGLVPAALAGIDIEKLLASAAEAEKVCSRNDRENPAAVLAAFLFDNYCLCRDKFAFVSPKRGRVLGLWIEQLVAESLGKEGYGILPDIEINPLALANDPKDRTLISYSTKTDSLDERMNLAKTVEYVDPNVPKIEFEIEDVEDLAGHFVMWEYAVAMVGYLMKVCPFDQPDVQVAKTKVLEILSDGEKAPNFSVRNIDGLPIGNVQVRVSRALESFMDNNPECNCVTGDRLYDVLFALFSSIHEHDYFSLNAFIPFAGEGRREALEAMRHVAVETHGVASCLEIGPRYLHSTGQLQKGGPNDGVFLVLSADEQMDITLTDPRAHTLGHLAKSQALGDFTVLSERGRRCVHIHLPDHSAATLRSLARVVVNAARGE